MVPVLSIVALYIDETDGFYRLVVIIWRSPDHEIPHKFMSVCRYRLSSAQRWVQEIVPTLREKNDMLKQNRAYEMRTRINKNA